VEQFKPKLKWFFTLTIYNLKKYNFKIIFINQLFIRQCPSMVQPADDHRSRKQKKTG